MALLLSLGSLSAHASDSDDGKIVHLEQFRAERTQTGTAKPTRANENFPARPAPGTADQILRSLVELHAEFGVLHPTAAIRAFAHQLTAERASAQLLKRYEMAFRFGMRSRDTLGPGLSPGAAHERAAQMIRRRHSTQAIRFENLSYQSIFVERVARGFALRAYADTVRASAWALLKSAKAVERGAQRRPHFYAGDLFADALHQLARLFGEIGIAGVPDYARAFALHLMHSRVAPLEMTQVLAQYDRAVRFATRDLFEPGLGLGPASAHEYARDLLERRAHAAGFEINAFEGAYKRLVRAAGEGGFGLPPAEAHARARALAESMAYPTAQSASEILDHHHRVEHFLRTPIRRGGLGYAPIEVEASLPHWLERADNVPALEQITQVYATVVAAHLHRGQSDGTYDEAQARQTALEMIGDGTTVAAAEAALTERGYALKTLAELDAPAGPDQRSRRRRLAACVRWLLGR